MLELDAIAFFLRVVERGSFTAAAKQSQVPLSTLSRKIMLLEEQLGIALLHRTTRRISVTSAGRDFYDRCVRAESMISEAEQHARATRAEPVGVLRILTPYALGFSAVEPALVEFRRRYPKITPEITFEDQPLDLVEHGFDVALRRGPFPDSGYAVRLLARGKAQLVAAPSYLDLVGRPAHPHDVKALDALVWGRAIQTRWRLRHLSGESHEVLVDPVLAANESTALAAQAARGAGVALLSPQITRPYVETARLEIILPDWERETEVDLAVMFVPHAAHDLKVRLFIDYCVEVFAQWSEAGVPRTASLVSSVLHQIKDSND